MTIEFSKSASRFRQEFDGEPFDHYLSRYGRFYNNIPNKDSAYRIKVRIPNPVFQIYDHLFRMCLSKKILSSRRKLLSALIYYGYITFNIYLQSHNLSTKHFLKFRKIIDMIGTEVMIYDLSGASILYSEFPYTRILPFSIDRNHQLVLHIIEEDIDILEGPLDDLGFYRSDIFVVYLLFGIESAKDSDSFDAINMFGNTNTKLSVLTDTMRHTLHSKILSSMTWPTNEFNAHCNRLVAELNAGDDRKALISNEVTHLFNLARKN